MVSLFHLASKLLLGCTALAATAVAQQSSTSSLRGDDLHRNKISPLLLNEHDECKAELAKWRQRALDAEEEARATRAIFLSGRELNVLPPSTCACPDTSTDCNDGVLCTVGDHCDGNGQCVGGGTNPCFDGIPCTVDSCDASTDACVNAPDNGLCTENECGDGVCNSGSGCSYTPNSSKCTQPDDPCFIRVCEGDFSCSGDIPNPGALCDDGDSCTDGDTCDANGDCVGNPKSVGDSCNDSDECTSTDICTAPDLDCVGTAITCDDDVDCTDDDCDPLTGCVVTPNDSNCAYLTDACNDAFCTSTGCVIQRKSGNSCGASNARCSDGVCLPDPCTVNAGPTSDCDDGAPSGPKKCIDDKKGYKCVGWGSVGQGHGADKCVANSNCL